MACPDQFIVGLTGGIGSGKSCAARLFAQHGVRVVDTDEISHALSKPPSPALIAIAQEFGSEFICPNGTMDRARMRTLAFSDSVARTKLESIFHPLIQTQTEQIITTPTTAPYTMLVVPLLFEKSSFKTLIQRKVVVDCPEEEQIARVMNRSQLSSHEVLAIMATQISRQTRLLNADDIILNNGSLELLDAQVTRLHQRYLMLANSVQ